MPQCAVEAGATDTNTRHQELRDLQARKMQGTQYRVMYHHVSSLSVSPVETLLVMSSSTSNEVGHPSGMRRDRCTLSVHGIRAASRAVPFLQHPHSLRSFGFALGHVLCSDTGGCVHP